jgi:hypothetical protein
MKMKNDVAVIIILLLICFVVIPMLSRLFVQEGFYNMNTIEVNRVLRQVKAANGTMKDLTGAGAELSEIAKQDLSFNNILPIMLTKNDRVGEDVSYNFCLGKLTCENGYSMKKLDFKDNDNANLYYPYCISGNSLKDLKCEGGLKSVKRAGDQFDGNGYTPLFSFNRYQTSGNPYYITQYEVNADKTGLKRVNDDLLECDYITDSMTKVACFDAEKQTRPGATPSASGGDSLTNALLALLQANVASGTVGSGTTSTTSKSSSSSSTSSNSSGTEEKIKCVADFGTEEGDPLCCGQTGVLQSSKYTCPHTQPYCSDFKCGSKFGTCRK